MLLEGCTRRVTFSNNNIERVVIVMCWGEMNEIIRDFFSMLVLEKQIIESRLESNDQESHDEIK